MSRTLKTTDLSLGRWKHNATNQRFNNTSESDTPDDDEDNNEDDSREMISESDDGSQPCGNNSSAFKIYNRSKDFDRDEPREMINECFDGGRNYPSASKKYNMSKGFVWNGSGDSELPRNCTYKETKYNKEIRLRRDGTPKRITETFVQKFISRHDLGTPLFIQIIMVIIVVVGAFLIYNFYINTEANKIKKTCNFMSLIKTYPNQQEILWKSLKYGIESVLNDNPVVPSVFLLAYKEKVSATEIAQKIVQITCDCMETNSDPLILNSEHFESSDIKKDYGAAITKYKPQLIKSKVLLVLDLNKISAYEAQAFHVFCDIINPLVNRAVIYFTMKIDSHPNSTLLDTVQEQLTSRWSNLDKNTLHPLIARVTDQVFFIKPENT